MPIDDKPIMPRGHALKRSGTARPACVIGAIACLVAYFASPWVYVYGGNGRTYQFTLGAGALVIEWGTLPYVSHVNLQGLQWADFRRGISLRACDQPSDATLDFLPRSFRNKFCDDQGIVIPLWPIVATMMFWLCL